MHYPPQPSAHQPFYPPSEIYLPEQPQEYAPLMEVYTPRDQPFATGQEIAIYYSQTLLTAYKRLCKALLILLIALLPLSLIAGFVFGGSFNENDIFPLVLIVVIGLAAISSLAWWIRFIGSLSGPKRKPVLYITHEGITIQNNIAVKYRFIPWNEIQTIYASSVNLKIRHVTPFSSSADNRDHLRRSASKKTVISLLYLDTPAQEMLRRLCETYANELRDYHIRFEP